MSQKKAIIFDCWHTLFTNKEENPFKLFADELGYDWRDREFLKTVERNLMLEKKEGEQFKQGIRDILEDLGFEDEELVDEIYRLLKENSEKVEPFSETLEVLEKLKQDYKLGLVTNTYYVSQRGLEKQYGIESLFDATFFSFREGVMKPDPKAFQIILSRLNVEKEEAVMVGDSLEDDVEAAEDFGIDGFLIDRGQNKSFSEDFKRISSLRELENLV